MSLAVANRYARALADVVFTPGSGLEPAAALDQVKSFATTAGASQELRNVLNSPAVAPARKRAVAEKLGGPLGHHRVVRNFLYVIIDHRRAGILNEIASAFEAVIDARLGRARADVRSAVPLTDAEQDRLRVGLARLTGKEVRCDFQVDPSLIGGISARIGSTIYDCSVRGQLDTLRSRMSAG